MNIFEKATREKLRFEYKGFIDTEDAWDLKVEELDKIYQNLKKKESCLKSESLLNENKEDKELKLQIKLITHIVKVKLEEKNNRLLEKEKKDKNERITAIIEAKENKELEEKDIDELKGMLD